VHAVAAIDDGARRRQQLDDVADASIVTSGAGSMTDAVASAA
jgi:hypothetical protein